MYELLEMQSFLNLKEDAIGHRLWEGDNVGGMMQMLMRRRMAKGLLLLL